MRSAIVIAAMLYAQGQMEETGLAGIAFFCFVLALIGDFRESFGSRS